MLFRSGTKKYGVEAEQKLGESWTLRFAQANQELLNQGTVLSQGQGFRDVSMTMLQAMYEKGRWHNALEYRHTAASGIIPLQTDLSQNILEDGEIVSARVGYDLNPKTQVQVQAQTSVSGEPDSQLRTTLIRRINEMTSVFLSHVVGSRGNGVLAGLNGALYGMPLNFQRGFGSYSNAVINPGSTISDMTLGGIRKLGHGVEGGVSQTVGPHGMGKRVMTVRKGDEKQSFSMTHESDSHTRVISTGQERKLDESTSVYSSANRYEDVFTKQNNWTTVRGVKRSSFNNRLLSYVEDENGFFTGNKNWVRRFGSGFQITPELLFNMSYEKTQQQTSTLDTASQVTRARMEYLKYKFGRFYVDGEYRKDDAQNNMNQFVSGAGGEMRFFNDLSVSARYEFSTTNNVTTPSVARPTAAAYRELQLGFAYRPSLFDWVNFIGEYKNLTEKSPASQANGAAQERTSVIRGEVVFDITRHFSFAEKLAFRKNQIESDSGSRMWLSGHRLIWHTFDFLDLATEYRFLRQTLTQESQHGALVEAVVGPFAGIRIGAGYNFMKFDPTLQRDLNVESDGIYARIIYDPIETAEKLSKGHEEKVHALFNGAAEKTTGLFNKIPLLSKIFTSRPSSASGTKFLNQPNQDPFAQVYGGNMNSTTSTSSTLGSNWGQSNSWSMPSSANALPQSSAARPANS